MYKSILITICVLFLGFTTKSNLVVEQETEKNKDILVLNFKTLEPLLYTESKEIQIVNFWAMWCAPCVKELPILEAYQKKHPNVKITLVSLDFPEDIETKLKPFLKKKGITSKVVLLDDPDANSWIDKVNPKWSGSIPFTIIFNNKKRTYHERMFESMEDLENEIKKIN
ncbi:Thioredoxin-like [Polaribacter sp. KT25b]|uniref:TlpA family protein disulfide reductase n=1 Tax=Polaribacter sp. KT25b TaxID=1855336 RepID=UPI00087DE51A|nr:thioredoxin-like domain-containing protein [Polaribacter sp. KT25b]SDR96067.1 Thioredoxin-like [Polaribacter sp. KT25b]